MCYFDVELCKPRMIRSKPDTPTDPKSPSQKSQDWGMRCSKRDRENQKQALKLVVAMRNSRRHNLSKRNKLRKQRGSDRQRRLVAKTEQKIREGDVT